MTVTPAMFGCLALFVISGCDKPMPDTRAADESAVKDSDVQWSKKAAVNDLEGVVSFYTDDASLLPPNAPIAIGKPAIKAVWATMLSPDVVVSWEVNKVEAARSGDLAYITGVYQITPKDPNTKPPGTDRGKMVEVWKKQADGTWKTVADIFNSDLPVPAESKKR